MVYRGDKFLWSKPHQNTDWVMHKQKKSDVIRHKCIGSGNDPTKKNSTIKKSIFVDLT